MTHENLKFPIDYVYSYVQHSIAGTKYELSSVQSGGALKIHQIDSNQDTGIYTCIVKNRANEEARRDIELSVNSNLRHIPFCSLNVSRLKIINRHIIYTFRSTGY